MTDRVTFIVEDQTISVGFPVLAELPELPHVYTEGDTKPPFVVAFSFDISAFTEVAAAVERPDGTAFENVLILVPLNNNQSQYNPTPTDWIEGCSQLTIRLKDAGGKISHVAPIIVRVRGKPTAPT